MAIYKTCTFAFFVYQKLSWTSFSVPKGGPGMSVHTQTLSTICVDYDQPTIIIL